MTTSIIQKIKQFSKSKKLTIAKWGRVLFLALICTIVSIGAIYINLNSKEIFANTFTKKFKKVSNRFFNYDNEDYDDESQNDENSPIYNTPYQGADYTEIYQEIDKRKNEAEEELAAKNNPPTNSQPNPTSSNNNSNNPKPYYAYPDEILTCTRNGDDLLVLVNKKYKLPSTYAPSDLVSVNNSGIRTTKTGLYVRNIIIQDLTDMTNAIKGDGIDIAVLSAYRSYSTQQSTYNYWVSYNGGNTDAADRVSARAGHSQHQLGTTLDFTSSEIGDALGTQFENTDASRWLTQNAWKYGFVLSFPKGWESETGFNYEPWHYRYIGPANASSWHNSGQILEVWLRGFN